jgi:hypothetical protein
VVSIVTRIFRSTERYIDTCRKKDRGGIRKRRARGTRERKMNYREEEINK